MITLNNLLEDVKKWGAENTGNEPSISCFYRAFEELKSYVIRNESKLTEIEKQEPVAWQQMIDHSWSHISKSRYGELLNTDQVIRKLYTNPVQQAPAVAAPSTQEFSDDEYICIRDAVDRLISAVGKDVDGDQSECSLCAEFIDELIKEIIIPLKVKWHEEEDWCGYVNSGEALEAMPSTPMPPNSEEIINPTKKQWDYAWSAFGATQFEDLHSKLSIHDIRRLFNMFVGVMNCEPPDSAAPNEWQSIEALQENVRVILTYDYKSVYSGHREGGQFFDGSWELPTAAGWMPLPAIANASNAEGAK